MADERRQGTLMIIGGHEERDPEGERTVLREVARHVRGGKLVLATVASHQPEGYFEEYEKAFDDLDIGELVELYVEDRNEASDRDKLSVLDDASAIFFSGGDQLRITSQIGDTGIEAKVRALFQRGGLIAGTSAGASVMSDTMLVKGTSGESYRFGDLHMAPGLGLIRDVIIDQHFAERGRMGRLLGAVAHNPRVLGLGIDEDTAAIFHPDECLEVLGRGTVMVVDGQRMVSDIAHQPAHRALNVTDVVLHALAAGARYDLGMRRPLPLPAVKPGTARGGTGPLRMAADDEG